MQNLMLILIVFLCAISCNSNLDKQYQLETLTTTYQDRGEMINRLVEYVKAEVEEGGNRDNELEILDKVNDLIKRRTEAGMTKISKKLNSKDFPLEGLEQYSSFLQSNIKYAKTETRPTNVLNKIEYYNTKLRSSFDEINYTNYLINLSQLELLILGYYARQVGVSDCWFCVEFSVQSESDTINTNESCKLVVFPLKNLDGTSTFSYDSIRIFHEGKEINANVMIQQIGQTALLNFTPSEKGRYHIKGFIYEKSQFIDIVGKGSFYYELNVK